VSRLAPTNVFTGFASGLARAAGAASPAAEEASERGFAAPGEASLPVGPVKSADAVGRCLERVYCQNLNVDRRLIQLTG